MCPTGVNTTSNASGDSNKTGNASGASNGTDSKKVFYVQKKSLEETLAGEWVAFNSDEKSKKTHDPDYTADEKFLTIKAKDSISFKNNGASW